VAQPDAELSSMNHPEVNGIDAEILHHRQQIGLRSGIDGAMSTSVPSTSKRILIRNR